MFALSRMSFIHMASPSKNTRFMAASSHLAAAMATTSNFRSLHSDGPSAEAISKIQDTFRKNPSKAKHSFHQHSYLEQGLLCQGDIRHGQFTINADEPTVFGGSDQAPNPVEILLFSLASCQEITFKAYANAMSIPLKSVTIDLKGDIDFRGFFAVSQDVRPGFNAISGTVTIDSPTATLEELEELKAVVDAHCPVKDMVNVPMSVQLRKA